jgi:hypothetical protein
MYDRPVSPIKKGNIVVVSTLAPLRLVSRSTFDLKSKCIVGESWREGLFEKVISCYLNVKHK